MKRHRARRYSLPLIAALWIATGIWQTHKPLPPGTFVNSGDLPATDIEFLHDLTFRNAAGETVREQEIFDAVFTIVDEAATFVVLDFFLFNDQAGNAGSSFRPLSRELADRLLAARRARPMLEVVLVTDPINDVYGGDPSPLLTELRNAGIGVAITDLTQLRDSNPGYSAFWRLFIQWFGNSTAISWLPNPFADGPGRISLRSWLSLLNFKANHRKLVVADRADGSWTALVTSGNPHDASSSHSNVALRFSGPVATHLVVSEFNIARFSGLAAAAPAPAGPIAVDDGRRLAFVTEAAIRDRLLAEFDATQRGDRIDLAMFYLSDRLLIDSLRAAASRGVDVRLVLDPNKDAFGIQKDGVPNRPVAEELVRSGGGRIAVRWYQTHGEQFHTKIALVTRADRIVACLGSANLTRRNLGNYNLEANVALRLPAGDPLAAEMQAWFERLWSNENGDLYTVDYSAYRDPSQLRYWRYRFMEATGLSTF